MIPQVKGGLAGFCREAVRWLDSPFIKTVIQLLCFVILPAGLSFLFSHKEVIPWLGEVFNWAPETVTLLGEAQVIIFLLFWAWLFLLRYLENKIRSKAADGEGLSPADLIAIHELIDGPVEAKAARFGKLAKSIAELIKTRKPIPDKKVVFSQITQPEDQIFVIAKAIIESFKLITKDKSKLKLRIAEFKNGRPTSWIAHQPHANAPSTDINELQDKSAILSCATKKTITIVSDIAKALKLGDESVFKKTLSGENASGSLVCYAIKHPFTNDVPYVISIHSNKKNVFTEAYVEVYEWIFEKFAMRLGLEHSLRYLKENARD